ncbi:MAG TPA: hypothetical protein VFY52_01000, partial [Thermoleophilaceae bacterium]|nr:hypothetical protein [Thermoleophilaceae bacterium]
ADEREHGQRAADGEQEHEHGKAGPPEHQMKTVRRRSAATGEHQGAPPGHLEGHLGRLRGGHR